jgi:hypothetical protein
LSSLIFTCKNYLDWDIFRYFYFFTKDIALLSLIVNKNEVFIYNIIWRIYHCRFVWFCMTFWIYIHVRKRNKKWILRLCNFNWRVDFFWGGGGRTWHWSLSICELFFLPNLQLNIGKKYLKTAIIIDESLIHAIVSRNLFY